MSENKFINLTNYSFIKISGVDAKKFLQGQITCNLDEIPEATANLAAHCNPQGRIISLFRIFQQQDSYYLFLPRTMLAPTIAALKKYSVFFKVQIAEETMSASGYLKNHLEMALPQLDKHVFVKLFEHPNRYLVLNDYVNSAPENNDEWKHLDILSGIPSINPETSGKFLPHEINLQNLNAISFNKGCYTGQEIIARMHYRGKLKNAMYRAKINGVIKPGEDIFVGNDAHCCGYIVDTCQLDNNENLALIVVDNENAQNAQLYVKTNPELFFSLL